MQPAPSPQIGPEIRKVLRFGVVAFVAILGGLIAREVAWATVFDRQAEDPALLVAAGELRETTARLARAAVEARHDLAAGELASALTAAAEVVALGADWEARHAELTAGRPTSSPLNRDRRAVLARATEPGASLTSAIGAVDRRLRDDHHDVRLDRALRSLIEAESPYLRAMTSVVAGIAEIHERERASGQLAGRVTIGVLSLGGVGLAIFVAGPALRRHRAIVDAARRSASLIRLQQGALDVVGMVAITDARGSMTYVNDNFCDASGYPREDLIGSNHRILNSGVHPASFFVDMYRAISAGTPWRGEICNRARDGRLYWVDTSIVPVPGPDGRPDQYIALGIDITAQRQAVLELTRASEFLDLVIGSACLGTWDLDPVSGIMHGNRHFFEMLDEEPEPEVTRDWLWDRIHPDDVPAWYAAFETARHSEQGEFRCEVRLRGRGGDHRWILCHGRVAHRRDDGEIARLVGVNTDIADQKELQATLETARLAADAANRAKSDFLANMSHEIRTPMTAILGFTELLEAESDSDDGRRRRRDAVRTISRNGEHLLELINDILDLSKIEAGRLEIQSHRLSLSTVLEDVRSTMHIRAEGKGIGFAVEIEGTVPSEIHTDDLRVRQILTNLVGNAIKFTEVGGVTLRVRHREDTGLVELSVVDTGIGLTPEQCTRIFEPFRQADESTTREFGGTGLGLSISQRLAELLGGTIDVTSSPGVGSTFTLSIDPGDISAAPPLDPDQLDREAGERDSVDADRVETGAPAAAAAANCLAGYRVLLVEDGPDNRRLISFHLRRAGATVEEAEDGRLGLERALAAAAEGSPFDVVVMDMQMPVMDGYTAAKSMRAAHCPTPIVALTAHAMDGDRQRCIEAGCDDYGTKPVDRTRLVATVARLAATGRPPAQAA